MLLYCSILCVAEGHPGVRVKTTPLETKTPGKMGFQYTDSGAGELLLLPSCRAEAAIQGVFACSTDADINI